jgi:hypothetical protein
MSVDGVEAGITRDCVARDDSSNANSQLLEERRISYEVRLLLAVRSLGSRDP